MPTPVTMKMPEHINLLWQHTGLVLFSLVKGSRCVFVVIVCAFKSDSSQSTWLRHCQPNVQAVQGGFIFLQPKKTCCIAHQPELTSQSCFQPLYEDLMFDSCVLNDSSLTTQCMWAMIHHFSMLGCLYDVTDVK